MPSKIRFIITTRAKIEPKLSPSSRYIHSSSYDDYTKLFIKSRPSLIYNFWFLILNEFPTTDTEDIAIANPAKAGESNQPNIG